MDAVDLRILRTIGVRPFELWPRDPERFRPGYLAARCGVSPETVKARLHKMQEDGILARFDAYPNTRLLGLHQTAFHLRLSDRIKERVREELDPVEGLVSIYDFLGADLCVDLCYRDEADLARKLKLVARLTEQDEIVRFYERMMPAPARALTPLDWRIVKALRTDGRRPPEEVAAELGVSARTVRRRHAQMEKEGAIDTVAVVDYGKIPDLKVFNLVFHMKDPNDHAAQLAVCREFDATFLCAWQPPSARFGSYHTTQFAHNNAEMEALRRRGAALPGVTHCEVLIPTGVYHHDAWLEEAIEAHLQAPVPVPG